MLAKRHRQNHDFTIAYHLAGSCHTPDAAYALLMDLREDRQAAVDAYNVQQLRDKAKEARAREKIDSRNEADQIEGRADLLELENNRKAGKVLFEAAQAEIACIDKCIAELQPRRKFAHLPDAEAVEAIQAEEWASEMRFRAENFLLTTGTIPPDEFASMRQHPNFAKDVLPRITEIQTMIEGGQREKLLAQVCAAPRLLESIKDKLP
jgi:hypothetical protein